MKRKGGQTAQSVAIGGKGLGFLTRMGAKVVSHVTHLGDKPHLDKLIGPVKVLLDAYTRGEISLLCFATTSSSAPCAKSL